MKYIFRKRRNTLFALIFDLAGAAFTRLISGKRKPRKFLTPKNILLIRMDHLGDVLPAAAVPKALKENFSDCRVTFLTASWAAPLLANNPFIDEVMIYNAPWFSRKKGRSPIRRIGFWALLGEIKKRKFDLAISLRGDLRENILIALAGIPERVGYGITGGGFLLTREAPYRKLGHESEHTRDLLAVIGVRHLSLKTQLYFTQNEEIELSGKLNEWGFQSSKKYIGYQVEAGTPAKDWPEERAKIFLGQLAERYPEHGIVLVGSNAIRGRRLYESLFLKPLSVKPHCINLTGKTSLRELCLLLKRFELFVGPDSGPSHIAESLGIPVVFLYSGTNRFEQWKPLAENTAVLKNPVPCAPCHLEKCYVKGHPCMSRILPEQVLAATGSLIRP
jgi:ADP-heptose:LPS heptosyltransferase